eukprot:1894208-Lingulodinium_polyedra.AAC.1
MSPRRFKTIEFSCADKARAEEGGGAGPCLVDEEPTVFKRGGLDAQRASGAPGFVGLGPSGGREGR